MMNMAQLAAFQAVAENPSARVNTGINPMIDPTAKNFSPSATAAGAGIYGTNLDKQLSFMNPGINTSALI